MQRIQIGLLLVSMDSFSWQANACYSPDLELKFKTNLSIKQLSYKFETLASYVHNLIRLLQNNNFHNLASSTRRGLFSFLNVIVAIDFQNFDELAPPNFLILGLRQSPTLNWDTLSLHEVRVSN